MVDARPLALPFYHHGMHDVLPIGARLPRRGKTVRAVFGEPIDCDGKYIEDAAAMVSSSDAASPRLWEALAARAHEALARLERQVRPDADSIGGAS